MATRSMEMGAAGRTVAANLESFRRLQGLTQADVSAGLAAVGHLLGPTAVSRVERGTRRCDVDDLAAFSAVLGVAPAILLSPLGAAHGGGARG